MKFYGREQEIEALRWQFQRAQETKVARMAVVTGRRRIGKTTLIRKAFEGSVFPFIYLYEHLPFANAKIVNLEWFAVLYPALCWLNQQP